MKLNLKHFLISEFTKIETLVTEINDNLIRPLVLLNFGEGYEDTKIIVPDITKEITTRYFQILSQLIKAKHTDTINIDGLELSESLGLPINKIRDVMDTQGSDDTGEDSSDDSSDDDTE